MNFDPGFDVRPQHDPLGFLYGPDVAGPEPELRRLDAIRPSLRDPHCAGPDPVYAIAMDVAKRQHLPDLEKRMLLYGVVTYARGRLGREPVRSQGHVHRVAAHSGWSPPELYEIWSGRAVVYMQEFAADDPGRCFAVAAEAGEKVVVPPGWAHATLSADPASPMTFGAWCERDYGFVYDAVRARQGLAWYALLDAAGELQWQANPHYRKSRLLLGPPRVYGELRLASEAPIYTQYETDPDRIQWISEPACTAQDWKDFVPCRIEREI